MSITSKSGRKLILPTHDEDREITREAIEDGTHWTDEALLQFRPSSEVEPLQAVIKASRGRPKSEAKRKTISIRLSPAVDEYFRATGKGWQTRINEVLEGYVKDHQ